MGILEYMHLHMTAEGGFIGHAYTGLSGDLASRLKGGINISPGNQFETLTRTAVGDLNG